jgi:hypothetical protein
MIKTENNIVKYNKKGTTIENKIEIKDEFLAITYQLPT